jgi:hypothetical protein
MCDLRNRALCVGFCLAVVLIAARSVQRACVAAEADAAKLAGVSQAVSKFIEEKQIAGAVTLVANKDKVLHLAADGMADVASKRPMQSDAIFWIASMTKPRRETFGR